MTGSPMLKPTDNSSYEIDRPITKEKTRSRIRWWLILCLFFGPIFVAIQIIIVCQIIWSVRESIGRSQLYSKIEVLRDKNLAVDNEGLQERYVNQSNEFNGRAWIAILDRLHDSEHESSYQGVPFLDRKILEPHFEPDGIWEFDSSTQNFVKHWESEIEEMRQLALKNEPANLSIHFDSIDTVLNRSQQMRQVARIISIDAMVAHRSGDSNRLYRDIASLMGCSMVCQAEPFIVSNLICVAIKIFATDALKLAVEWDRLDSNDLLAIQNRFRSEIQIGNRWRSSMEGEMAGMLPVFLEPHKSFKKQSVRIPARGYDGLAYIKIMERAMELNTTNLDAFITEVALLDAQAKAASRGYGSLPNIDHLLVGLLVPAYEAYGHTLVESVCRSRLAILAVEVRLYKNRYGKFPTDLSTLEIQLDDLIPSGGKPFGYRIDGDLAVLWGFTLRESRSTPDQLPSITGESAIAKNNSSWIWRLR